MFAIGVGSVARKSNFYVLLSRRTSYKMNKYEQYKHTWDSGCSLLDQFLIFEPYFKKFRTLNA